MSEFTVNPTYPSNPVNHNAGFCRVDDWHHAANAVSLGDVTLGSQCSIWYGAVLRGDDAAIHVGERTNLQDLTMVHPDIGQPLHIGNEVTVGHRALLHCRQIGDACLIGMGSILMEDVEIGDESLVAAGCVVTPGTKVPARSLVMGVPGKVIGETTAEQRASFLKAAAKYVETAIKTFEVFGNPRG